MSTLPNEILVKEFKKLFDDNSNGKNHLTNEEFKTWLESEGYYYDSTKDDNPWDIITYDDYIIIMHNKYKGKVLEDEIISAFQFFSKFPNGVIPRNQYKNLMLSLNVKVTKDEVKEMINEADPDNTGYIDIQTYVRQVLFQ